jgi:hypothetical protein
MTATPWGKFFWADWLADPGLRACSATARGIWMDMLCVAATHDPAGYVAIAGRAMTLAEIARLTGEEIGVVERGLAELAAKNVFSRSSELVIYSRRMIRDAKKTSRAREIGKKGGNPNLRKQNENPPQDNGQLNQENRRRSKQTGGLKPNKLSRVSASGNSSQDNGEPPPMARARARSTCQKLDKNLTSSVESESESRPSKINGHPRPTSGPATALPEGRAGPPSFDSKASKQPHKVTKAEFEAKLDAKRKTGEP